MAGKIPDFSESVIDQAGKATKNWYNFWKGLIQGNTSGVTPGPGLVGEYLDSNVPYAGVALTTGVLTNVTSKALTAGDWQISALGGIVPAATTTTTGAIMWISTVSATFQNTPVSRFQYFLIPSTGVLGGGMFNGFTTTVGPTRLTVATATTIFLCVQTIFSGGTMSAFGHLQATRAS